MTKQHRTAETVSFEVWRSHLKGGPDVCVYRDLSETSGSSTLELCLNDKASAYPDAPIEFYLVRATTTRAQVTPTPAPTPTSDPPAQKRDHMPTHPTQPTQVALSDRDERRMRAVILEWLDEAEVEDAKDLSRKIAANLRPTIDSELRRRYPGGAGTREQDQPSEAVR